MTYHAPQLVAGGTINPCRFVKLDTTANKTALQAGANARSIGISQEGAQDAPIPGAGTDAAASGEQFRLHTQGEVCLLELGTGGCTAGDMLIADTNGMGVTAAATGTTVQWIGAIALETASAGEKALVQVMTFPFRPALS